MPTCHILQICSHVGVLTPRFANVQMGKVTSWQVGGDSPIILCLDFICFMRCVEIMAHRASRILQILQIDKKDFSGDELAVQGRRDSFGHQISVLTLCTNTCDDVFAGRAAEIVLEQSIGGVAPL